MGQRTSILIGTSFSAQWMILMLRNVPIYSIACILFLLISIIQVRSRERLAMDVQIEKKELSKWFGEVVALNNVSIQIPSGVVGY